MPNYDYYCPTCENVQEIFHSMKSEEKYFCEKCKVELRKKICAPFYVINRNGKLSQIKEEDHRKKVKDPERARRSRLRAFGHDAVGDPAMQNDPRHVIKRGKTLGGQEKTVDKQEFIKAASQYQPIVDKAVEVVNKTKKQ